MQSSSLLGEFSFLMLIGLLLTVSHETKLTSTLDALSSSSNDSFQYRVAEHVVEGSVIADLSLDFVRVYRVDKEERHQLRFLVLETAAGWFDVDEQSGVLTTSLLPDRQLDREELCDDGTISHCVLDFIVVVQPYFHLLKAGRRFPPRTLSDPHPCLPFSPSSSLPPFPPFTCLPSTPLLLLVSHPSIHNSPCMPAPQIQLGDLGSVVYKVSQRGRSGRQRICMHLRLGNRHCRWRRFSVVKK